MSTARDFIERGRTLHAKMGDDLASLGGILRCTKCHAEQPLGDIAANLKHGWPKCCGYTMTWVTARLLAEESREHDG